MSARRKTHGTGQSISTGKAAKPASKSKSVKAGNQLPNLEAIFGVLVDAYALVFVASKVLHNASDEDDEGLAIITLRQGVTALGAAVDRLESAEMQLDRIQRAGGVS